MRIKYKTKNLLPSEKDPQATTQTMKTCTKVNLYVSMP